MVQESSIFLARDIAFTQAGWALRMGQSAWTHANTETWGGFGRLAQGSPFSTPEQVDRFDQEVAGALVQSLLDPTYPLPPAIRLLRDRLRFSEAVNPEGEALTRALDAKIERAINGLEDVDDATRARLVHELKKPAAVHCRVLQIPMDDGSTGTFLGYRIQHNRWHGTDLWTGGGLRWAPDVSPHEVMILAKGMTWKNILHQLKMGGAKGGIACDPSKLSDGERKRLAEAYATAFAYPIAAFRDKPAGDIGTTSDILMLWHQQALNATVGELAAPGSYTGKPYALGHPAYINGTPLRGIATGLGGKIGLETLRRVASGLMTIGNRHVVQGAGNAGMKYALLMAEAGETVLGISDTRNAWFSSTGLSLTDLQGIEAYKLKNARLSDILPPNMTPEDLLMQETDVLVPAGAHWTIGPDVVTNFKGQVILPLANHPYVPEAEEVLVARALAGELLDPADILMSGGGVTSSRAESNQNLSGRTWTPDEEMAWARTHMEGAVEAVYDYQRRRKDRLSLSQAAWEYGASLLCQEMRRTAT